MLSKVRKIGTNTIYYGFGNILNKSLGLILIPIYARRIPIEQFGVLAILELIILAFMALLTLGITSGHERFFFLEKEKKEYGKYLFSNVTILFLVSFAALFLISLAREQMSMLFWGNREYSYLILLACAVAFFEINNVIPFQILQYEGKPVSYVVTNFLRLLISLGATIYFVIIRNLGVEGILYGRLSGSVLAMVFQYVAVVIPRITAKMDITKVTMAIRYGMPLTISLIGFLIFASSDRYMLNWLADERQTGMYGFGYKIANIILLLVNSVGIGFLPSVYQQEKETDNKRFYRKMLFYYTVLMTYAVLIFLFFYKIILWPLVQNKEYWNGLAIVPVMSLAFLVMGMNYFVNIGLTLKNKTRFFIIPTFIAAAVNIGLNFIFIRKFGFTGAAYSALISQGLNTLLIALLANRFMPIEFEWKKIFTVIFLGFVLFLAGTSFEINKFWIALIRICLLIFFPFILYWLKLFESIELQRAFEGFLKLRKKVYLFMKAEKDDLNN